MTRLSVNINKVALIRNARGGNLPDLYKFAADCEEYGAQGITVHPRPDERHIRYADLEPLKDLVRTEFNVEGYPNDKFINKVIAVKPHQVTLVPDPPGVLTSSEGWDTIEHKDFLSGVILGFKDAGIRVSLFLDAKIDMVHGAKEVGADRIELYTGDYAKSYFQDKENHIRDHIVVAKEAHKLGLGVNAGHDLNLDNLHYYSTHVPNLKEVSIGHALIADALYYGIQNVIGMYRHELAR